MSIKRLHTGQTEQKNIQRPESLCKYGNLGRQGCYQRNLGRIFNINNNVKKSNRIACSNALIN